MALARSSSYVVCRRYNCSARMLSFASALAHTSPPLQRPEGVSASFCGAARQQRRGLTTLLVDGGRPASDVLAELSSASRVNGDKEALEVLAVGQKGVVAALIAAAGLEHVDGARPTFVLKRTTVERVQAEAPRADFTVFGNNHYILEIPAIPSWEAEEARRKRVEEDTRLLVGNATEVMKLAKAIAARAKAMEAGRALTVETSLLGQEKSLRLRVARLAHAVARAHHWQVAPEDAARPVRTFRCCAVLVEGTEPPEGKRQAVEGGNFLRVMILPEGPAGGFLLGQPGDPALGDPPLSARFVG
eukprot:CAMPEP_0183510874 /NCGR_PEP_ID=MMETSP0371-20130417/10565_1 /TAXON_ID=268820 /ORGANISM="Peridinium aciculiferum, Strain PAER-2" /LENGTH=302 /DNA_ID=CAMNT_0025707739 /DNA_START=49 /DNA_END=955 /DNA_ORIENTATION=+